LYGKLRRDFGLPAAAVTPKTTIEVVTDELPKGYDFSFAKARIAVASPALLSVPVEMTDATVFYQSVVLSVRRQTCPLSRPHLATIEMATAPNSRGDGTMRRVLIVTLLLGSLLSLPRELHAQSQMGDAPPLGD
jgi:hypothetical protein